jgi:coenzyme F420-0:L-glutamate ligase/coenzyme F420-1:gamma-L-glutamate ligase
MPPVRAGDDLAALLVAGMADSGIVPDNGAVLVVAQKIVSKAEGRLVRLDEVVPSPSALELSETTGKDARLVELILGESVRVVRAVPGILIVQHRLGIVSANAGVDQSNIDHAEGEFALLLPEDPDRSASHLRDELLQRTGKRLGVIISDSVHRPWRLGSVGIAIGCAGVLSLDDRRGSTDLFGRELQVTVINRADSIATAALLVMGETSEGVPAALVSGFAPGEEDQPARASVRPVDEDLFR